MLKSRNTSYKKRTRNGTVKSNSKSSTRKRDRSRSPQSTQAKNARQRKVQSMRMRLTPFERRLFGRAITMR